MESEHLQGAQPDLKKVFNAIADIIGQRERLHIRVASLKKGTTGKGKAEDREEP